MVGPRVGSRVVTVRGVSSREALAGFETVERCVSIYVEVSYSGVWREVGSKTGEFGSQKTPVVSIGALRERQRAVATVQRRTDGGVLERRVACIWGQTEHEEWLPGL